MPTLEASLAQTTPIMSCKLQLCVILQRLLGKRGVDWMKRRTKQRMTAIHVSIPVRVLEDFDETLRFNQSRSAKITQLIQQDLQDVDGLTVRGASTRNLVAALTSRDDVDDTMKTLLLQILTKSL